MSAENTDVQDGSAHPITSVCSRMYQSQKDGDNTTLLRIFDELLALIHEEIPEDETVLATAKKAWGWAIMASLAKSGLEAAQDLILDFEELVNDGLPCSFLRALTVDGDRPAIVLQNYSNGQVGPVDCDAVEGCIDRFRTCSRTDITELMAVLEVLNVRVNSHLSDRLQRYYVLRMKTEDPEEVLEEMKEDGLVPSTAHPYNMILNKATATKKSFMEYYDEMLDNGIRPEPSTLRILLKKPDLTRGQTSILSGQLRGKTHVVYEEQQLKLRQLIFYDGDFDQALRLFKRILLESGSPPIHIFNILLSNHRCDPQRAEEIYRLILDNNAKPNAGTFSKLIAIWNHHRLNDSMDKWVQEMQKHGLEPDNSTSASILDSYVRSNQRGRALQFLHGMLKRGQGSSHMYNTLMKLGPFDFAVGILGCILVDRQDITASARSTLTSLARDPIAQAFVEALNECDWEPARILKHQAVMSPTGEQHPSLVDCMRLLMREVKLAPEEIDQQTKKLDAIVTSVS